MPLISTRGAASAQGFGEFASSADPVYIEQIFSTYLYTGNGSTQTITNGIDLAGKGGMAWIKSRSNSTTHMISDTARGVNKQIYPNLTNNEGSNTARLTSFTSSGFGLSYSAGDTICNETNYTYASWTFRKQPKFFDVVTYTGTGSNLTVSHNLGSVPGCIIIKNTSNAYDWTVYHRSLATGQYLVLNSSAQRVDTSGDNVIWNVTSTSFNVASYYGLSYNSETYVAYLFAHDAGGFGLSGTDNVISCGSYTGDGAANGQLINLGYEAQWVMIKQTNASGSGWWMTDTMRGWTVNGSSGGDATLYADAANAESNQVLGQPEAQGFRPINDNVNQSGQTYIYIAIRRGPMKVPTSGTSVFSPNTSSGTGGTVITTGFPLDAMLEIYRSGGYGNVLLDRLRGIVTIPYGTGAVSAYLTTNTTGAEQSLNNYSAGVNNTGFQIPSTYDSLSTIYYSFRRAPGFFDVVCYTGTGSSTTVAHNLGAVPQLIIVKRRDSTSNWMTGCNFTASVFQYLDLNSGADGGNTNGYTGYFGAQPTASVFTPSPTSAQTNTSGATYVAYLFATVAGVSKVGSYTGTGTTKQIDCGFTGGARFVLIKRLGTSTDPGIGDWYVYDSARGIVAGNDPYLRLNSTAAEVTNTDYVDTYSAGFELSSTAPAALNANGGTFIFLAIA
jgi:hypothetical protein